jgi:hypothetical protein
MPSNCLTLTTSPNPSTAGQIVILSGRLLGPHRRHAVVLLWRRFPGWRRFHPTVVTRTDRSGHYSISAQISTNRWWYVTSRGFRSDTVHQRVAAVITVAQSATRAAPGDQVSITGNVAPAHPGNQLVLQQLGPG